ncbi:MAG: hypothetical protein ACPL4K_02685, partial [Candidatus Margulisiibacteriota bacterium]
MIIAIIRIFRNKNILLILFLLSFFAGISLYFYRCWSFDKLGFDKSKPHSCLVRGMIVDMPKWDG